MDSSVRLRRALVQTPLFGAVLVQGLLLVHFASSSMAAHITDPDRYGGRWWHGNEPLFAFAGYGLVVVSGFLLALAWTKVARPRPAQEPSKPVSDEEGPDAAVSIDLPAFLRPKTKKVRPGAGALGRWTALGGLVLLGGVLLGILESLQMFEVLRRNPGDPSALQLNSTVWIRRLMESIAPATQLLGAVVVGVAWGVYWPLPPAKQVVVGQGGAGTSRGPDMEWRTVE